MFIYKTDPLPYQATTFEQTRDELVWGLFLEQGLGKTKIVLDTAAYLAQKGEINGLLVVAPNGVHQNWIKKEIPKHFPFQHYYSFGYSTNLASTKAHQLEIQRVCQTKHFAILAMSYSAFITTKGREAAKMFLTSKNVLYVLDESTRIKTPHTKKRGKSKGKGKTTGLILQSAEYAKYRRILTGTPIANSPLDIWTQLKFLKDTFWEEYRLPSYYIFKHYFADIIKKETNLGHTYEHVKGYRNIKELHGMVRAISTRLTKEECLPDLPPKLYSTRYYSLNPEQQRIYKQLVSDSLAQLGDHWVTCELAVTLLLRLQQVICGYVPAGDLDEEITTLTDIGDNNPRLDLLSEIVEDTPHQGIIWARFTRDVDLIMERLGDQAVRYDGVISHEDRAKNLETFTGGGAKWFVAKASVGGEGLTLTNAQTVIYYNNSFKLTERLQSEDRAHRIGTKQAVLYYDIICENTVDGQILEALFNKFDIATQITGDKLKTWL